MPHYLKARAIAAGDNKTLAERRDQAIAAFQRLGIEEKRLLDQIKVQSRDDITGDLLVQLRGTYSAIKDGELSLSEAFPEEADNPGRPPMSTQPSRVTDVDSAATAHEMGREARRKNAGRTQWPGRWRDQANIEAWLAGWDSENADIAESEGKN
jgi:hypothetical protein